MESTQEQNKTYCIQKIIQFNDDDDDDGKKAQSVSDKMVLVLINIKKIQTGENTRINT